MENPPKCYTAHWNGLGMTIDLLHSFFQGWGPLRGFWDRSEVAGNLCFPCLVRLYWMWLKCRPSNLFHLLFTHSIRGRKRKLLQNVVELLLPAEWQGLRSRNINLYFPKWNMYLPAWNVFSSIEKSSLFPLWLPFIGSNSRPLCYTSRRKTEYSSGKEKFSKLVEISFLCSLYYALFSSNGINKNFVQQCLY